MKDKTKKKLKEGLTDALLELILSAVCLVIGIGALVIFGVNIESIDFELAFLLGLVILIAILLIPFFIKRALIKKKKANTELEGESISADDEQPKIGD